MGPIRLSAKLKFNILLLTIIVGGLLVVGCFVSFSRAAASSKPPMQGALDRNGLPATAYRSIVNGFVLNLDWSEVQPNSSTDLVTTKIDNALTQARANNAALKIRFFAGSHSPAWTKTLDGPSVTYIEPVDNNADSYQIPRFWTANYKKAYDNVQTLLAQKYDNEPVLRDITIGRCMTVYAEPFIRGIGYTIVSGGVTTRPNVDNLHAAGYTLAADQQCHRDAIDAHKVWTKTRSSFSFNPYQKINDSGSVGTDMTYTTQTMDYCRSSLGKLCNLENNSIRESVVSGYQPMYDKMKALGPPITFQTAVPGKICDIGAAASAAQKAQCARTTLDWAISQGANAVELNSGYGSDFSTASDLSRYDQRLEANSTGDTNPPADKIGDINNDGKVDIIDLSILLSNFNRSGNNNVADINQDTYVNIADFNILLSEWGT